MQGFLIIENFFEKISNFLYFFLIQTPISIETSKQHVRYTDAKGKGGCYEGKRDNQETAG